MPKKIIITEDTELSGEIDSVVNRMLSMGCQCGEDFELSGDNHQIKAYPHNSGVAGKINGESGEEFSKSNSTRTEGWWVYIHCTNVSNSYRDYSHGYYGF